MGRRRRIDFPGAWHHVMHRGARREAIFVDDEDCVSFLDTVGEAVERFAFEVHAYALMPNHYHLLARSPSGNLSRAMQHLNGVFTRRFNRRRGWDGPLFRGRFRSQVVDSERYQRFLVAYIHLNPVRAHLVGRPDEPCWTSHRALTGLEPPEPWHRVDRIRRLFGTPKALHDFVRTVHQKAEPWPDDLALEDGWVRAAHEADTAPSTREQAPLRRRKAPDELLELLQAVTGASLDELRTSHRGRGANPARRFAIAALARRPELTYRDVADLLGTTVQQVSNALHRNRTRPTPDTFSLWLRRWNAALEPPTPAEEVKCESV